MSDNENYETTVPDSEDYPSLPIVENNVPDGAVEFELTIKEISIRFKGNIPQARIAQASVNKMIDAVTHLQNQTLNVAGPTGPLALPEGAETSTTTTKPRVARKTRVTSNNSLGTKILEIRDQGFFAQKRTASEVRDELAKLGYNFESKEIAASLKYQTTKKVLLRDKNGTNNWVYYQPKQ